MCNTAKKHKGDRLVKEKPEMCRKGILFYESRYQKCQ